MNPQLYFLWFILPYGVTADNVYAHVNTGYRETKADPSLRHPLDPLTAAEIKETSEIVKRQYGDGTLIFATITLLEPAKSTLAPFLISIRKGRVMKAGDSIPRRSVAVYFSLKTGQTYETIVNLTDDVLESTKALPIGTQQCITEYDVNLAERVTLSHPEVITRLKKLGLEAKDVVFRGPFASGYYSDPALRGKRLIQGFFYFKNFKNDNFWAHPLDFSAVVDIMGQTIVRIRDLPVIYSNATTTEGPRLSQATLPRKGANYDPAVLGKGFYRKDSKPLKVTSEGGRAFRLKGYEVSWQKFKFRIGFNAREGVVIHGISYKDGKKVRPLLYRASVSEMVVPYGDPRYPLQKKSPLDAGEYGLGLGANEIQPNTECLPDGQLLDVNLATKDGLPKLIRGAICVQEEDGGILYSHMFGSNQKTIVARARVLVINFVTTLGNYDYGFYWKFHQDASISFQVGLTGLVSTNLILGGKSPYATRVLPRVHAAFHQHLFNVRLDTMFDGESNSVSMVDIVPVPDKDNPYGNGFITKETPLRTSLEGTTDMSPGTNRVWRISSPKSVNPITGLPGAWKLIPTNRKLLLAKPGSEIWRRAQFAEHAVWVTQFRDGELYAAGDYPNQSKGGQGLPEWVKRNESIVEKDIVVWHTVGVTHITRVEDFPIMGFEKIGFTLKPANFFTSYPGLDVPSG